jgi:hypothetical protein
MSRPTRFSLAILAAVVAPAVATAQPVVVNPKPGNGGWDVSYTRLFEKGDPPSGTELSTTCKTLAAAKQEAARLQKWSQSMDANSDWRLKKIYIEGEDAAGPPKDAAPRTPSLADKVQSAVEAAKDLKEKADKAKEKVDDVKETYDRAKWGAKFLADPKAALEEKVEGWEKRAQKDARKLGDTLKEYGDNVADAYKRAKDLKDDLLKMDKATMEKSFKKVNDAVAAYNKTADEGAKFFDGKSGPFPKMKEVGPDTAKAAAEWKDARNLQFDLESRKDQLDKKKEELDRERTKLAGDWKELAAKGAPNPADPKVISLRKRLAEYQEKATAYATDLSVYRTGVERLRETAARLTPSGSRSDSLANAPAKVVGTWVSTINRDKIAITPDGTFTLHSWTGLLESSGTVKSATDKGLVTVRIALVNRIADQGRGWEITGTDRTPFEFTYDLSSNGSFKKIK